MKRPHLGAGHPFGLLEIIAASSLPLLVTSCAPPPPSRSPTVTLAPAASAPESGPLLARPLTSGPTPSAPPTGNTLTGTLGGRPFTALSALLVRVNGGATVHSSMFPGKDFEIVNSYLVMVDRLVGCEDMGGDRRPRGGPPGELILEVELHGRWPWPPRTVSLGFDAPTPDADGAAGTVWLGSSGNTLQGTLQSTVGSTLQLDATTRAVDPTTRGELHGSVHVVVCR